MGDKNNKEKKLHPRNRHRFGYDFTELVRAYPEFKAHVLENAHNRPSINFSDPQAVKALNRALLLQHYDLKYWDIPPGYLCPPVPSRADYVHYMADLLGSCNDGKVPTGPHVKVLDIGTGANLIYPLIGHREYGWSFLGTDIDKTAIQSARKTLQQNPDLERVIGIREQPDPKEFFYGMVGKKEHFDLVLCNPPFHESAEAAQQQTARKIRNLTGKSTAVVTRNFGGQPKELWCKGGERRFVIDLIKESKKFAPNCLWFTSLIANKAHLKPIYATLKRVNAVTVNTIEMTQGNKISRVVAWTFLGKKRQDQWVAKRWKNG